MYTKQPKKLLIMNILDILRRYSDAEHRLSQKEIVEIARTWNPLWMQYWPRKMV